MAYQTVILEREGRITTLRLNRPEVLNAWNQQMAEEVTACLRKVSRDEEVRVLILTGEGRAFSAGVDIAELREIAEGTASLLETEVGRRLLGKVVPISVPLELRSLDKPVIAAINGLTAGLGFSIVVACDIRLASEKARFTTAYIKRGLSPGAGATYYLPRLVGMGQASRLVLTGDIIDAQEARRIGLVDELVPPQDLMKAAKELAQRIAQNPPLAVKLSRQLLGRGFNEPDLAAHLDFETSIQNMLFGTADFREGIRAFLEGREPKFMGK